MIRRTNAHDTGTKPSTKKRRSIELVAILIAVVAFLLISCTGSNSAQYAESLKELDFVADINVLQKDMKQCVGYLKFTPQGTVEKLINMADTMAKEYADIVKDMDSKEIPKSHADLMETINHAQLASQSLLDAKVLLEKDSKDPNAQPFLDHADSEYNAMLISLDAFYDAWPELDPANQGKFSFKFMKQYYPMYIQGAWTTLLLAFFTLIFGTLFGMLLAVLRLSSFKPFKWFASAYIEFIRGTPVLVQLMIIFYGITSVIKFPGFNFLGISFEYFMPCVITLAINSAAYVAEIFRAGIQAVDKGQTEAARSLGMSQKQNMLHIILPQAIRNVLPALGNEFIVVVKESAIVSIVGVADLMFKASTVRGITYRPIEPYIVAAIIYFIITFTLSKVVSSFERRMRADA